MADVSHQLLLAECYRGGSVSPRSASTPGPSAPDSPASSAGRFSASPSSTSYHYSPYHHPAMGLMGSFLSVGPYGPYAALAAAAMAGQLTAPPPHPFINRLARPPLQQAVSRVLPFSVENILKPDFGRVQPLTAAEQKQQSIEICKPAAAPAKEAIKRPAAVVSTSPSPNPSKKIKTAAVPITKIKADPADGRTSSCTDNSDAGSNSGKEGNEQTTELPTDPTKMTDPAKWPAWIFCTRYSDRPSSGKPFYFTTIPPHPKVIKCKCRCTPWEPFGPAPSRL